MKPQTALAVMVFLLISQIASFAWFAFQLSHFRDYSALHNTAAAMVVLLTFMTGCRCAATILSIIAMWRGHNRAMGELREDHERRKACIRKEFEDRNGT